jgi:predicted DNA-binding transcriptional regulator AlpA
MTPPQILRHERAGRFPERVQLAPGVIAWVETELDAHAARLMAGRGKHIAPSEEEEAA